MFSLYSQVEIKIFFFSKQSFGLFFKKTLFILFLDMGGGGEKHQCVVASCVLPTGDLARNPGMYPNWESN